MDVTEIIEEKPGIYQKYKNSIFVLLKIVIALGIIYYLFNNLNPEIIFESAKNADRTLLILAALGLIPNIYFQYLKWQKTSKYILADNNKIKILTSLFYGFSGGLFTPARIGEYFGRAITFKNKSLLQVTAAIVIDKFFTLIITLFVGLISVFIFLNRYHNVSFYVIIPLVFLLFIIAYLVLLLLINENFWDNFLFNKIRQSKKLYKYLGKIRILKNLDRKYTWTMFLFSFLFYLTYITQFTLLLKAFYPSGSLLVFFWASNLIIFTKSIIPAITFAEFGIREGAAVYFLTVMYNAPVEGLNSSIILYFINIIIPSLVGLLLLVKKNDI